MIESYSFGSIVIDGNRYTSDLLIFPNGEVVDSWRRNQGHRLSLDDIQSLIESEPEIIIAGTGDSGLMEPDNILEKYLSKRGIEFFKAPSREAIELYNKLNSQKKVGACFHLTC